MIPLLALLLATLSASAQQAAFSSESTTSSSQQWTVFHHPIKRVAVIGAGPAGLQAAAKLVEHNFTVRLFERAPLPGGNWMYTDETPVREPYPLEDRWKEHWQPRPLWDSLHTNSPAVITEMPDVPYLPDTPWVISNHVIQRHVRSYASLHNLNANDYPLDSSTEPVTSYSSRVEKLQKVDSTQTWRLTLRKLERLPETGRIKAQWWTEDFDAVVIATGPYVSPHVPNIAGLVDWSKVKDAGRYSVYHSQSYRRPERYENKVSTQGPHPFQLRILQRFPNVTSFVPEIAHFGQLAAHDRGIKDGEIHLVNGSVLRGIDEVILATGYIHSNIFLPNFTADGQPADLHWTDIISPTPPWHILMVGVDCTSSSPVDDRRYQSYAFAKVWEGTAHLPTQRQMREDYDRGKYHFRGFFGTGPAEALFRQYVAWLNNESLEKRRA
ncbi:FAD/NAD-P-binding domain-containing protein, partial [Mycena leptocephala]